MFTRRIPRFYCVFQVRTGTIRRISYQTLRQLHPSLRSIPIACPSRAASGNAIPSDNDSPLPPSIFPTEGFKIIDSSTPVEEETLPFYRPELFYPVRLGEVFQNRYQVVAKLGYGASSTVWLGHDLIEQRYVALKIFVNRIPRNPELEVLQHFESIQSEHNGPKVIYADLHSGNLLLGISNESLLAQYEQNELEKPTPRKILANRVIYVSQISFNVGKVPHLCDFGHARICINGQLQQGRAMPIQYRTPEMLLDMLWDYSVDLWAFALTIWDMLEPEPLFKVYNYDSSFNEAFHFAYMVALLGPPLLDFLKRSATSAKYWDDDGKWKGSVPIPSPTSLESRFTQFDGERKTIFLDFIRKLLAWDPQQRPLSGDAYMHPWLAEVRGEGDDS
ncbi:hypothetical protein MCOR14_007667 [Pyricularia oryzae]|nr:hypothetical protein MCOR14_007667 [Pyricularia oryzae]